MIKLIGAALAAVICMAAPAHASWGDGVNLSGPSVSVAKVRHAKRKPVRLASSHPRLSSLFSFRFEVPTKVVCAPVASAVIAGVNLIEQFRAHIAQIIEPVRPGFVWIKTASGQRAIVAERYAPAFVAFIRDLESTGYRIKDIGGYTYRRIAGTRMLSKHAFGAAVDINQLERNVVSIRMDRGLVSKLAARHGLISGGDWRHGDLGHFEIASVDGRGRHHARHVRVAQR